VKVIGDNDHMQTPSMVGKDHISGFAPFNVCRSCSQISTTEQVRKQLCIQLYLHPHEWTSVFITSIIVHSIKSYTIVFLVQ